MDTMTNGTMKVRDLARELGVDWESVMVLAEQADDITGDAYDETARGLAEYTVLSAEGVEAVRLEIAAERPTLRVSIDMASDLAMAGEMPNPDDYADDDAYDEAVAAKVGPMTAAWISAAHAEAHRRGYDLHVIEAPYGSGDDEWTYTLTGDGHGPDATVEREIWQAAHDAI